MYIVTSLIQLASIIILFKKRQKFDKINYDSKLDLILWIEKTISYKMKIRLSDNFWKTNKEKTYLFFFNIYLFGCSGSSVAACKSVPWPGVEPRTPASGVQTLSHWTTREVPREDCLDLMGRTMLHPEILAFHTEAEPNGTLPPVKGWGGSI